MLAKLGEDVVEVGLEGFKVSGLEGQPLVLDLSSENIDVVEFRPVGWQEVQGQAFLLELLQHGPDRSGGKARRC